MSTKINVGVISLYLPYNVKAKFQHENKKTCRKYVEGTVGAVYNDGSIVCHDTVNATPDSYKLILDSLDNYKDVNSAAFIDLNCDLRHQIEIRDVSVGIIHYTSMTVSALQICLKNHIDIFRLIDQGLAVAKQINR